MIKEAAMGKYTIVLSYTKNSSAYGNRTISADSVQEALKKLDKFLKDSSKNSNSFTADKVTRFFVSTSKIGGMNSPDDALTKKHKQEIQKVIDSNK